MEFRNILAILLIAGLALGGLAFWSYSEVDRVVTGENQTLDTRQATTVAMPVKHGLGSVTSSTENEGVADIQRDFGRTANLPRPSEMNVEAFETILYPFLHDREYQDLGWAVDKSIRDTGPYIKGRSYGTHPAVRVYYSPEIMTWLLQGRLGTIPDGAVMVKEQYEEPAARHAGKTEQELRASLKSWTVMIKDSRGGHDGWFWSNPYPSGEDNKPHVVDNHKYPFNHPESGFGHYCLRCHAATQSPNIDHQYPAVNNEFTFASLRNIQGFPGEPIIFRVDDSWRQELHAEHLTESEVDPEIEDRIAAKLLEVSVEGSQSHPKCTGTSSPERCELEFNEEFATFFNQIPRQAQSEVLHLPPVTHDWVIKGAMGKQDLATSNQCKSCHAGLVGPFGPAMFVGYDKDNTDYYAPGWHISPYGEWRWTPMGLAGRDPIFFAQLESEVEMLKQQFADEPHQAKLVGETLMDTCLRCHGAMGKHQFELDKSDPNQKFTVERVYSIAGKDEHLGHGEAKYGSLARDGISCVICHRSIPREQPEDDDRPYLQYFLETSTTGNFLLGPPDELYGPFKDDEISPYAMEHAIAIKPKYNAHIQSSQMCGTCHTVTLPVVDHPFKGEQPDADQLELVNSQNVPLFKDFHHHVEQATYLEWLNSEYENEFNVDNPKAQTCQDCHMSSDLHDDEQGIHLEKLVTRIAAIQDNTYPDAENLTELENLNIRYREEGYRRHNFVGLNVFLIELFRQFDEVLGVRKNDFMTGSSLDIPHAIKHFQRQARNDVVDLALTTKLDGNQLTARLDIQNKVGHRFPSGVGFRRAFVELLVFETTDEGEPRLIWSSGRTNRSGMLIGADDQPLKTEFFETDPDTGKQLYQPHHQIITSQDQVQIYETLLQNHDRQFTTSFIRGDVTIKDNRLLPRGWQAEGRDPALAGPYLKATYPGVDAQRDPRYQDGSGSDEVIYQIELPKETDPAAILVTASIYYQSIPPYFLKNLFDIAPEGPATRRLHYMISNAKVDGTAIEDWKLLVQSIESRPQSN